jgi:hypothetical protein
LLLVVCCRLVTNNDQPSTKNKNVKDGGFVMRSWRFWLNTLILSSQYNPPRFVELLMLTLAIAMLTISSLVPTEIPYMVLGLSFVIGASISILVREAIAPSPQTRVTQLTALLLLIVSFYGFADLIRML